MGDTVDQGTANQGGSERLRDDHSIDRVLPWLLRQKVMLPDAVDGYVERSALAARCDPSTRRVTVFNAPGGFGKTTLLAEACRRLRDGGTVVAWLTLDEDDTPKALATYLAFAFSEAGLDIVGSRSTDWDFEREDYLVNLLLHGIEAHGGDCVLAVDDLHRLSQPESLAVVDRLVQRAPANLHLAFAFRGRLAGIDFATPVLQGRGISITVDDLRFDKREIARFFDTTLSRSELAELNETSAGWPIALRIQRNVRDQNLPVDLADEVSFSWIETHLWTGLSSDDRDLVLDVGLFEWIDPEVVDRVLGAGSVRRILSMPALSGLLRSVGGESGALDLHPLVRQYCADRRFRESPERYRTINRMTAAELARQGDVVAAMRHASVAADPQLVGEILQDAGGFRVWFEHGLARFRQASEFVTADVRAIFPRLALVHCMDLTMRGRFEEAEACYVDLGARTDGFTRRTDGRPDRDLEHDHVTFRYVLENCGCRPMNSPESRATMAGVAALAEDQHIDPLLRGASQYAMCEIENRRTNLDRALAWAQRARDALQQRSWYVTMYIDLQVGHIAMIQGRVADAYAAYSRARRAAEADLLEDGGPMVLVEALSTELRLERNETMLGSRQSRKVPKLARSGAALAIYAAACEAAIESAWAEDGLAGALAELEQIIAFAQGVRLVTLRRCLLAMRVSLLAVAGRVDEANRAWDSAGFSERLEEMVDLGNQTWREMEAVSCAGLRLLIAQSRYDAARELADALLASARERGLRRPEMRGLALAVVLEHRAGDPERAQAKLVEYLKTYAETDYFRVLAPERLVVVELLSRLDLEDLDIPVANAAESLRHAAKTSRERTVDRAPDLTAREYEILQRLEEWRDKEIADALQLSENGVRYHNKKIFRKLGVRSRFEAIQRARSLGILPTRSEQDRIP